MSYERYPDHDPELARTTRFWHSVLFAMASLLSLPAAFVFFLVTVVVHDIGPGALSDQNWMQLVTAVIASATGVAAWIALGLLFLRPADPRRHRITWFLTVLFGTCAIPCAGYWLVQGPGTDDWLHLILCLVIGCRATAFMTGTSYYRLACQSLALRRALASPAPADQKGVRP